MTSSTKFKQIYPPLCMFSFLTFLSCTIFNSTIDFYEIILYVNRTEWGNDVCQIRVAFKDGETTPASISRSRFIYRHSYFKPKTVKASGGIKTRGGDFLVSRKFKREDHITFVSKPVGTQLHSTFEIKYDPSLDIPDEYVGPIRLTVLNLQSKEAHLDFPEELNISHNITYVIAGQERLIALTEGEDMNNTNLQYRVAERSGPIMFKSKPKVVVNRITANYVQGTISQPSFLTPKGLLSKDEMKTFNEVMLYMASLVLKYVGVFNKFIFHIFLTGDDFRLSVPYIPGRVIDENDAIYWFGNLPITFLQSQRVGEYILQLIEVQLETIFECGTKYYNPLVTAPIKLILSTVLLDGIKRKFPKLDIKMRNGELLEYLSVDNKVVMKGMKYDKVLYILSFFMEGRKLLKLLYCSIDNKITNTKLFLLLRLGIEYEWLKEWITSDEQLSIEGEKVDGYYYIVKKCPFTIPILLLNKKTDEKSIYFLSREKIRIPIKKYSVCIPALRDSTHKGPVFGIERLSGTIKL